jgi:hypothetical protein
MGCECGSNQVRKIMGVDINIKEDKEKNYNNDDNENDNKNINENMFFQNPKEDNTTKIENNPAKTDSNNDKTNKLKKTDIEEEQKNDEKNKLIEEKTDFKEKMEEKEIVSKNLYNQRVFDLINQIRLNPSKYSQTILENINYVFTEVHGVINKETGIEEKKQSTVFKKKVKVILYKGKESFREAAEILKKTSPMEKLQFNKDIVIPLPNAEEDIINSSFIKSKVNEIRQHFNINIYFKDYIKNPEIAVLLMIVDDSENFGGKKRECLLNPNIKYIGIDSKFIGTKFIAHFSFSK